MKKGKKSSARLSSTVRPLRYVISMRPDLEAFTFLGEEEIYITSTTSTRTLTLHSAELEIASAEYLQGTTRMDAEISYADKEELVTFTFPKKIPTGKGVLKISFAGILNDKMRGFYRSRYEHNGETFHMGVTQFESTDARRAFPCFDEPAHKAIFEVSLTVPGDRTAISNTLETKITEHESGYKTVKFAPSPKMSSYLLAFIVGHFDFIQKKTKTGTLVRVFTTPGKKHQATFALNVAVKCIEFYEHYFGIRYPLPVMDLIAIPDFAAGAMENWGAVTYRETAILVDSEHSAEQNKQRVALVIAHELAHQWFGNLVTMEWWTHLWLNEGFATYMEYVAIDAVFPKWNIWTHFVSAEHARGLQLDGLTTTHPIEVEVHHPAEISEIFDAVSYSKGASIIRMLATYIGEKAFRKGLQQYLKKHQYGNALTIDLWKALESSSAKPVGKVMKQWTEKGGYPVLELEEVKQGLRLTQSRFFPNRNPNNRDTSSWMIPITIDVGTVKSKQFLITKKQTLLPIKKPLYVKANVGETSFVRTVYSSQNIALLAKKMQGKNRLDETDRFGVIRDASALSQSGAFSTTETLKLITAYKNEESYAVWSEIAEYLFRMRALIFNTPLFEAFSHYILSLTVPLLKKIGWKAKKGESRDRLLLRGLLIHIAGMFGDTETIQNARTLFKGIGTGVSIDPNHRSAIYSIVAHHGGMKEFETLMSLYKETNLEEEKDRILRALSSFKNKDILNKTLSFAFSNDVRGQDTLKAVSFAWNNPYGREVAWEHIQQNWQDIVVRFGGGHLFPRFLSGAVHCTTIEEANSIQDFFKQNPSVGILRTVAQAVEQIKSNAAWFARDEDAIKAFLNSN